VGRPRLFGADYSVYVRIARMALAEKGVEYELVAVDIFAKDELPGWYSGRQPFGRIPAFEHDGFDLYETSAIVRYVDEAFDGSQLQPADPRLRARMNQIVGIVDSYAYRTLVWDIYVEAVSKPRRNEPTDAARVARALPVAETCLAELARLQQDGDFMLGPTISLADFHVASIFGYFEKAPQALAMLGRHAALLQWWERMKHRPSYRDTEPTS
jgi:glutathione S-transferase